MYLERIGEDRRLKSVDGLRTLAFLIVVLCHFGGMIGSGFPKGSVARIVCEALGRSGSVGTDTFFFLAAFLLCRSLRRGVNWKEAMGRRLLKFYPGLLAMLTLYVLLSTLMPSVAKLPKDGVDAVIYVVANLLLLPGIVPMTPIITIAWSLSYVVAGYVLVGGLFRLTASHWQRCLVWAGAAVLIWSADQFAEFPHGRLLFFPLGALFAEMMPRISRIGSWWWLVALAGLSAAFFWPGLSTRAIGIGLLVTGALAAPEIQSRTLNALIATLGRNSYAVFLSHGIALHLIQLADPVRETLTDLFALVFAGMSLVLVVALVFRTLVLDPLRGVSLQLPVGDRIPAR
ncbi:MAG: acyltransferase [Bryobacteraceae bacterium]